MTHKKTLLIAFFLSLFVLQQTQASAKFLPNKEEAQKVSVQTSGIPVQMKVTVAHLHEDTNYPVYDQNGEIVKCYKGDTAYGCSEGASGYPYDDNPVLINMDDYLLDVLPREMNVKENTHTLASLQAQALAARSYADFRLRLFGEMDNSVNFQIFFPNAYELYDPSASALVLEAVTSTSGQYLSSNGEAIDAQFASDSINRTTTCLNADMTQCHPYLVEVEDPISAWQLSDPACDAINNGNSKIDDPNTPINEIGKVWGMTQRGAIRWSKGNHCAANGDLPWPVKWDDQENGYKQILVHYYTGIDILDANNIKVAPDNRWNLLWHDTPANMDSNVTYPVNFRVQNTSTANWTNNEFKIGWQWTQGANPTNPQGWQGNLSINLEKGADIVGTLNIVAPDTGGDYILHVDISKNSEWFSDQNPDWPDAAVVVHVNGPAPVPTATEPPSPTKLLIPISQGADDAGTNPSNPCYFALNDPEVYLGACFNGKDIYSGFRFQNVAIPKGATIQAASIRFYVDGEYTDPLSLTIYGEKIGFSDSFDKSSPKDRITRLTDASVPWNILSSDVWKLGQTTHTPSLVGILQEIVNLPGWQSGSSLSIIFANNGSTHVRRVIAFERAKNDPHLDAAQLSVSFTTENVPTATSLPPGFTPPPTIIPTHTPIPSTPIPTNPPPPICRFGSSQSALSSVAGQDYGTPTAYAPLTANMAEVFELAQLLYRVRDEILNQTPEGQRITALYYAHTTEIATLMLSDKNLDDEGLSVLGLFVPGLQSLLDGKGDTVTITAEQVDAANAFLDKLVARGSPELQEAIQTERANRPLESMIGMTMDQAWSYNNGYQFEWLPRNRPVDKIAAQQGRSITIKFALTDLNGAFVNDPSVTIQLIDADGKVVFGPIGMSDGIKIVGEEYQYTLKTNDLQPGEYTLQIFYNAADPQTPETRQVQIIGKK